MKKVLIITIVAVLLVACIFIIVINNTSSSGFSIFGKYLGQRIASNDEVVAEANGVKINLSDVALPYFSAMVAYMQSEETINSILNDPNTTPEIKERIKDSLVAKPDPLTMLNRVIGQRLLRQEIEGVGITIPQDRINRELAQIKASRASDKPNEWSKYHDELLKALNITEDVYLNKYYKALQEDMDLTAEYEKTINVPQPTSDQVNKIMKKYNVDEDTAKRMYEDNYKISLVQNREDELAKSADVKLLDIEAVRALGDYFNN